MNFGLRETDLEYIRTALSRFVEIEKAAIFGSRAKGTYKPGSDEDLAVWGNGVDIKIKRKTGMYWYIQPVLKFALVRGI